MKEINEIGRLGRAERTEEVDKLFDIFRYGNTKMQRYQKVNDRMQQLYYFLNEYHSAEVTFLQEQEKKIINKLSILPDPDVQDKRDEEAEFWFVD